MADNDMQHLEFIGEVAAHDVEYVDRKDRQYGGSWKRRGGVGAFMMLARKWDRLENMITQFSYNVFSAIENQTLAEKELAASRTPSGWEPTPSVGSDGTILAEIRDLRRYLLLVEAEMMARGVIPTLPRAAAVVATHEQLAARASGPVTSAVQAEERRVPRFDTPSCGDGLADDHARQRTPEDGAQHETVAPWVVSPGYFERMGVSVEMRTCFWKHHAPRVHVLEPYVKNSRIPRVLRDFYHMRGDTWTLIIGRVPPDARSYFPDLLREVNMKEHEELPEWQRVLYTWDNDGNKFVLAETNAAWHVEEARS